MKKIIEISFYVLAFFCIIPLLINIGNYINASPGMSSIYMEQLITWLTFIIVLLFFGTILNYLSKIELNTRKQKDQN